MGHHSHLDIAGHAFMFCRDGYLPELAALFAEAERQVAHSEAGTEFTYETTVCGLRDRLQVQGFTAGRSQTDLEEALVAWNYKASPAVSSEPKAQLENIHVSAGSARAGRPKPIQAWQLPPAPEDWTDPVPTAQQVRDVACRRLGRPWDDYSVEEMLAASQDPLEPLSRYMDPRSFTRLLLECAPDSDARVALNLSELTGCCVELSAEWPVAGEAREEQLQALSGQAPLLVITEGRTDSRLLAAGIRVTHPHLTGFVRFFDYDSAKAEGGVSAVVRAVSAFAAAGVANRFIALVDNDTEGRDGLRNLRRQSLPDRCRVLHYPALPLLMAYPTLGPLTPDPILANVNGLAGSVEMYLGKDILENADGRLRPVQWTSWNPRLGQYQGALLDADKATVQKRFMAKVRDHAGGKNSGRADWAGIRAIADAIVKAFD